jgi:hypothetical protein
MSDYMNSGVNEMVMVDGENLNAASVCYSLQAENIELKLDSDESLEIGLNFQRGYETLQAENAKLREDIKAALLVSDSTNEINPSNYCEDDVLAVDNCVIEMHQILEAALDGKGGEG